MFKEKKQVYVPEKPLSGLQHTVIGGLAGMTECIIQQPTVYVKNTVQQGKPLQWNPAVLYRGVGVNCLSIAPIVGIQFGVNGSMTNYLKEKYGMGTLPESYKLGVAALSGFSSTFVCSPAELVMTVQQRTGGGFMQTVQQLARNYGPGSLARAMPVTAIRDMVCGVFGNEDTASFQQKTLALMGGSTGAGMLTLYGTQPLDTVKTVMQGQIVSFKPGTRHFPSFRQTCADIHRQSGLAGFYRGSVARGVRIVGAIFILAQARTQYEDMFQRYNILSTSESC